MAVTTESFNGDGDSRIFTVASSILSESHCRVDYYYDDGSGVATDHEVTPDKWDVINNSIVFAEAPSLGYVVQITVSTDGEGLTSGPSATAVVAANIDDVVTVSEILLAGGTAGDTQLIGKGLIRGIQFMAKESLVEDIVIPGHVNAFSVEDFTLKNGASLTLEEGATYRIL